MIVRLTDRQMARCLDEAVEPVPTALCDAVATNLTDHVADYDMPYIAWVMLRNQLFDAVWTERRWKNRTVPTTVSNALQRIVTAINAWERHPAFHGKATLGHMPGAFPAWRMPAHQGWMSSWGRSWVTDWAPFPVPGVPMRLLVPEYFKVVTLSMTRWSPVEGHPADHDWVAREEALLPFHELAAQFIIRVVNHAL